VVGVIMVIIMIVVWIIVLSMLNFRGVKYQHVFQPNATAAEPFTKKPALDPNAGLETLSCFS